MGRTIAASKRFRAAERVELKDDDHWHTRIAYALELSRVLPLSGEFLVAAANRPTAHDNKFKQKFNLKCSIWFGVEQVIIPSTTQLFRPIYAYLYKLVQAIREAWGAGEGRSELEPYFPFVLCVCQLATATLVLTPLHTGIPLRARKCLFRFNVEKEGKRNFRVQ
jgi:hypothetical protein